MSKCNNHTQKSKFCHCTFLQNSTTQRSTYSVHKRAEIITYDPVSLYIYYIIQKIIFDHPQSSLNLSVNTAAHDDSTVQSNSADHFL